MPFADTLPFRLLFITGVLVSGPTARADEAEPPLVPGFERFHRAEPNATGGRLLLTELSCTACHEADGTDATFAPKRGPRLDGHGPRLQSAWLREYIADPHSVKPGTTMPDVLHGLEPAQRAGAVDALAAYIESLAKPFPVLKSDAKNPVLPEFWTKGDRTRGRELYHRVGCVACHEPAGDYDLSSSPRSPLDELREQLSPEELKELGFPAPVRSVPHSDLGVKYTRRSLTTFLLDPEAVRPAGRMPNFQLSVQEASDLATYLVDRDTPADRPLTKPDARLVARGRELFSAHGCVNCHATGEQLQRRDATPFAELQFTPEPSCLHEPTEKHASYPLHERQQMSLELALRPTADPPSDSLAFALQQLNCVACHERDQIGGVGPERRAYFTTVGHVDIGDEGRLPPPLTGGGYKLTDRWLTDVLRGVGSVRPFMHARMPVYPQTRTDVLAKQLIRADRNPNSAAQTSGESQLHDAGRAYTNVGCVQCHSFRGEHLPGVVGIDLVHVGKRLRQEWFVDFLENPGGVKKNTRMPTFFPNGRSVRPEILGGDTDKQIAALWSYLSTLRDRELPPKIVADRSHDAELIPTERPILIRTFMKRAGPAAIAVGFPEQIHFAFDAESCRVVEAWRGRFLDAAGTWYNRFNPPAEPLGTDVTTIDASFPFAVLASSTAAWPAITDEASQPKFLGYRLDEKARPVLRYEFAGFTIEDHVRPEKDGTVSRALLITGDPLEERRLIFRSAVGTSLRADGSGTAVTNGKGLEVQVHGDTRHRVEFARDNVNRTIESRVTIQPNTDPLMLRYQWRKTRPAR